jgi:hypothetical protein
MRHLQSHQTRLILFKIVILIAFVGITFQAFTYVEGPPVAVSGAPGEPTCQFCHVGVPIKQNPFHFSVHIDSGGPLYQAGGRMLIKVDTKKSGFQSRGFELTALHYVDSVHKWLPYGYLESITPDSTDVITDTNGRQYVRQSTDGNLAYQWIIAWTAPSTPDTSSVYFFSSGVFTNFNGSLNGDTVYEASLRVPSAQHPVAILAKQVPQAITLWPLPATDHFSFNLCLANPGHVTVRLYKTNGILAQERTFNKLAGRHRIDYDLTPKPAPGTYIVRIAYPGATTARKLIIE